MKRKGCVWSWQMDSKFPNNYLDPCDPALQEFVDDSMKHPKHVPGKWVSEGLSRAVAVGLDLANLAPGRALFCALARKRA